MHWIYCCPIVEQTSDDSDDDGDGNYLHPSLFAPKKCSRLEELVKVRTYSLRIYQKSTSRLFVSV